MAVDDRANRRRKDEGSAEERARISPSPPHPDWNWLLQTLMGLQKTVGELSQAVATLTGRVDRLEEEVGRLDRKVDRINHTIYAAVVVLTAIGAVGLRVLNAASDAIMALVKEALLQSVD